MAQTTVSRRHPCACNNLSNAICKIHHAWLCYPMLKPLMEPAKSHANELHNEALDCSPPTCPGEVQKFEHIVSSPPWIGRCETWPPSIGFSTCVCLYACITLFIHIYIYTGLLGDSLIADRGKPWDLIRYSSIMIASASLTLTWFGYIQHWFWESMQQWHIVPDDHLWSATITSWWQPFFATTIFW